MKNFSKNQTTKNINSNFFNGKAIAKKQLKQIKGGDGDSIIVEDVVIQ